MADMIRLDAHIKEHYARKLFIDEGLHHFSPDWIVWRNEPESHLLEFVEVKTKPEGKFTAGSNFPYDGHGLDYRQFKNYMECFKQFKIRTKLIIYDILDKKMYWQYIDCLNFAESKYKYYCNKRIIVFALCLYNEGEFYNGTKN